MSNEMSKQPASQPASQKSDWNRKYVSAKCEQEKNPTTRSKTSKNVRTDTIKHFALDFVQAIKIRIKHSPKSNSMSIEHWAKQSKSSRASNALASLQAVSFYMPLVLLMLLLLLLFSSIHCEWIQPTWKTNDRKKNEFSCTTIHHSANGECVGACLFLSTFVRAFEAPLLYTVCTHIGKNHHAFLVYYIQSPSQKNQANFSCVNNSVNLILSVPYEAAALAFICTGLYKCTLCTMWYISKLVQSYTHFAEFKKLK